MGFNTSPRRSHRARWPSEELHLQANPRLHHPRKHLRPTPPTSSPGTRVLGTSWAPWPSRSRGCCQAGGSAPLPTHLLLGCPTDSRDTPNSPSPGLWGKDELGSLRGRHQRESRLRATAAPAVGLPAARDAQPRAGGLPGGDTRAELCAGARRSQWVPGGWHSHRAPACGGKVTSQGPRPWARAQAQPLSELRRCQAGTGLAGAARGRVRRGCSAAHTLPSPAGTWQGRAFNLK